MPILELDHVLVIRAIPPTRVHRCKVRPHRPPEIGDVARVAFAYPRNQRHEPLFMVECNAQDGTRLWLADLHRSEIERIAPDPARCG